MVLRVGILSTANIARKNILALQDAACVGIVQASCVGSRDAERARAFAAETGVPEALDGGYAAVLASPAVDVVYVPLPTALHAEWVPRAAAAGKHVLAEKPVARTAAELVPMLQALSSNDLVFMDGRSVSAMRICIKILLRETCVCSGVMFRHHERLEAMKRAMDEGALGAAGPRHVSSGFSFRGDESFFKENIRCKPDGDPLGELILLDKASSRSFLLLADNPQPSRLPGRSRLVHRRIESLGVRLRAPSACECDSGLSNRPRRSAPRLLHINLAQRWQDVRGPAHFHLLLQLPARRAAVGAYRRQQRRARNGRFCDSVFSQICEILAQEAHLGRQRAQYR
jgi:hypothetical protein